MKTAILLILSIFVFSSLAQAGSVITDCLNRGGTWYKAKCSVAKGSTSTKIIESKKGTGALKESDIIKRPTGTTGPRNPLINIPKVILPGKSTRPSPPPIRPDKPKPLLKSNVGGKPLPLNQKNIKRNISVKKKSTTTNVQKKTKSSSLRGTIKPAEFVTLKIKQLSQ